MMNVQELIDELRKISDKTMPVDFRVDAVDDHDGDYDNESHDISYVRVETRGLVPHKCAFLIHEIMESY